MPRKKIDSDAMALCQAVHTGSRGLPQRWIMLHTIRLQLGHDLEEAEAIARHAASRGWLTLNPGPVLHSVAIGSKLWLEIQP